MPGLINTVLAAYPKLVSGVPFLTWLMALKGNSVQFNVKNAVTVEAKQGLVENAASFS
jgi:hypothetical protein